MAKRFFTSDWHLGSTGTISVEKRPYKSVEKMNDALIRNCNQRAKGIFETIRHVDKDGKFIDETICKEKDIVIHVGDFCEYGDDNHYKNETDRKGMKTNPSEFISKIRADFVNIEGNHDSHNKVKSIGRVLFTELGQFKDVSVAHYPSWYDDAKNTFISYHGRKDWTVRICGHVHGKWKWRFDEYNRILNINVGVDSWNYHIVSESEILGFVGSISKNIR